MPGLGARPPSVNSPGLGFGQSAPGARPLTSSVHSLLAPGTLGLGCGWGGRISHVRARPTLGSGSWGHLTLVLLQRGRGVEPGAGLGLWQWRRLWARSSGAGIHPAGEEAAGQTRPRSSRARRLWPEPQDKRLRTAVSPDRSTRWWCWRTDAGTDQNAQVLRLSHGQGLGLHWSTQAAARAVSPARLMQPQALGLKAEPGGPSWASGDTTPEIAGTTCAVMGIP